MITTIPLSGTGAFTYKQTDYIQWLKDFGSTLGTEVKDNTVVFSAPVGNGISKSYLLENGCTACVNNYSLNIDYVLTRQPADNFGVIIYLYHFQSNEAIQYRIDDVSMNFQVGNHHTLRITNAQTLHQIKFTRNTQVRGLSIFLENDWIKKNTEGRVSEVFQYLKQVNYFEQFLNAKQKRIMNEIVDMAVDHPYADVYIKSRLYRVIDKLLENFLQRDISELPEKISEDDFQMLQKIETILTQSYEDAFPGIEKLSRISLMSESKLKKLFKVSFGMGLYEYFQKNRMHRAKEHILSGKYSITEVGIRLGYQNLSNFSAAFRKEFKCLPSELVLHK